MKLTRVGVDLAKQVSQVHGIDRAVRGQRLLKWPRSAKPGRSTIERKWRKQVVCSVGGAPDTILDVRNDMLVRLA
jgi:hypothetical protein